MFEAKEIDFAALEESEGLNEGTGAGRGFAVAGGVAQAVTNLVNETHPDLEVKTARAEGKQEYLSGYDYPEVLHSGNAG